MYCMKLHWNFQRGSGVLRKKSLPSFGEAWLFSGTTQYRYDNDDIPLLSNVHLTLDWQIWKPSLLLHATTDPRKQTSSGTLSYTIFLYTVHDVPLATCKYLRSSHQFQWISRSFCVVVFLGFFVLWPALCDSSLGIHNNFIESCRLNHTVGTFFNKIVCLKNYNMPLRKKRSNLWYYLIKVSSESIILASTLKLRCKKRLILSQNF